MTIASVFVELCALSANQSVGYYHRQVASGYISATFSQLELNKMEIYERGGMHQVHKAFGHQIKEITQYTPSCASRCVRIVDVFARNRHGGWKKHETTIAMGNSKLEIASIKLPLCQSMKNAIDGVSEILKPMKQFACTATVAADSFNSNVLGHLKIVTDSSGTASFTVGVDIHVTTSDLNDMVRFQSDKLRVRGFIKTKRGMSIHWGIPCQMDETEHDVLELLEPLYNRETDDYFCASRCNNV